MSLDLILAALILAGLALSTFPEARVRNRSVALCLIAFPLYAILVGLSFEQLLLQAAIAGVIFTATFVAFQAGVFRYGGLSRALTVAALYTPPRLLDDAAFTWFVGLAAGLVVTGVVWKTAQMQLARHYSGLGLGLVAVFLGFNAVTGAPGAQDVTPPAAAEAKSFAPEGLRGLSGG